jgi:hemerythrin
MGSLADLWMKSLSVGIDDIDGQHRRLFEIMEEVMEVLRGGSDNRKVEKTINSLLEYTEDHFTFEEELLTSNDYPELVGHKAFHKEFIDNLNNLKIDSQKGDSDPADLEKRIHKFLAVWFREHIRVEDRKYAKFLVEKEG